MNKHYAILPDGARARRTSKSRVYTHLVAYRPSYEYALAQAGIVHPYMRSNHAYYVACAKGEHEHAVAPAGAPEWKVASAAHSRVKGEEYVAEYGEDLDRAMTKMIRDATAKVVAAKDEGYYQKWSVEGWCGRLDLAQKLLASVQSRASIAEARILEAQRA